MNWKGLRFNKNSPLRAHPGQPPAMTKAEPMTGRMTAVPG